MNMELRPISLVVGLLLTTLGCAMILPAIVDYSVNNQDWEVFAGSSAITLLVGVGLYAGARGTTTELSTRQAFIMTNLAWIALSLFGALPYLWSGVVSTFTDAFFESMSGLTTTGSTVITGLDHAPPGILLWRGIQQWLGGLGIIVMAVAVLPMLQVGGMQLFKIEAFDTAEKIMPRATQISGSLTLVFIVITIACALAYLAAGMGPNDAIIHAMTTVATGGFSSKDQSIGYFNSSTIDLIAVIFMILGSIPFILYVQSIQGAPRELWRNSQVRVFLSLLAILVIVALVLHPERQQDQNAYVDALFNVTSIMTGTGYTTTNYSAWGPAANTFFFIIMFIGGCAGSTSCGIKIFRLQVFYETVKQHINRIFYPHGVFVMRFNGMTLSDNVSVAVMNFLAIYVLLFFMFAILLNMTGLDFLTALSAAATSISNVGPGLGDVVGPAHTFKEINDPAKWIMSAAMLVGRLELFTVLVLFLPNFWKA